MWNLLLKKWNQYRYRFVPWLAVNLKHRTQRSVPKGQPDKIIPDEEVEKTLLRFFTVLHEASQDGINESSEHPALPVSGTYTHKVSPEMYSKSLQLMFTKLGYAVERVTSQLTGGGTGVAVSKGTVPPGSVVSMYPGTIYQPYEPIFLASLANPFVFRCVDGILIDGNDKNLSRIIYRSCCNRDRMGPYPLGDLSWLTQFPANPLAVGQYVNNQSTRFKANVAYQEFDLPVDFPLELRQFVPNVHLRGENSDTDLHQARLTRVVVLVSTRQIQEGEELFSSYFTLVH